VLERCPRWTLPKGPPAAVLMQDPGGAKISPTFHQRLLARGPALTRREHWRRRKDVLGLENGRRPTLKWTMASPRSRATNRPENFSSSGRIHGHDVKHPSLTSHRQAVVGSAAIASMWLKGRSVSPRLRRGDVFNLSASPPVALEPILKRRGRRNRPALSFVFNYGRFCAGFFSRRAAFNPLHQTKKRWNRQTSGTRQLLRCRAGQCQTSFERISMS